MTEENFQFNLSFVMLTYTRGLLTDFLVTCTTPSFLYFQGFQRNKCCMADRGVFRTESTI